MSHRSCWKRLGIAHTTDTTAIRRAYAVKLKAIDLDRDADGFQALRDARDEAMYLAALPPDAFDDDDEADERRDDDLDDPTALDDDPELWGIDDIDAELDAEPIETRPEPTSDGAIEPDDAPYHALYDLLDPDTPDRERWLPIDEEAAAIRAAFDAILADPRMEGIDFYAHQEQWLATVIALAWPTSEPIVEPAVTVFHWAARAGEIGQDPAADFAVNRAAAARFERAVQSPSHPNHGAWRELTKPADDRSRRSWFVRSRPINALLRKIRTDYPTLEGRLDPWRVSLWQQPDDYLSKRWQLGYTLGAILFLNILIRLPGCDRAPVTPPVPVVQTLADAVAASSFRSVVAPADIARSNPDLQMRLYARFQAAQARGLSAQALADDIDEGLRDHVRDVLADPPYPVLHGAAALLVARGEDAKRFGWAECTALLFGGGTPPRVTIRRFDAEITELRRQALLTEPVASPEPDADRGRLDPDVARQIQRRVKLDDATFTDALMNRGAAKDRCETRIAAIQVALGLPQDRGEPLLRVLAN